MGIHVNKRDCEHGNQLDKCDTCDLIEAEKRIAELEAQREAKCKKWQAKYQSIKDKLQTAQQDKLNAIATERKRWAREDLKALEKLKLEQQAKGIADLADEWVAMGSSTLTVDDLRQRAGKLRKQASEL